MTQTKMRTVKFNNGAVMRISESLAKPYVDAGEAHYVAKKALRRFWKLQDRLEKNNNFLEKFDFSDKQDKNFLHKEDNGNVYAYLFRKNKEQIEGYIPEKKEIKKLNWWQKLGNAIGLSHFEPKEIVLEKEQIKIISYPMYQRFLIGVHQ